MKDLMKQQTENTAFFIDFSRILFVGLWFAYSLILTSQVNANQTDSLDRLFTIKDIHIDITARNANEARNQALLEAEERAYDKLLLKLTQPEGRLLLPELSLAEKQTMVSGIELRDEQSSSRRYIATFDVRFEPSAFSDFLATYNVPHVLAAGNSVVVFHSHSNGTGDYLWEPNPAMQTARETVDWVNRIRTYVFPNGELQERLMVTYGEVKQLSADKALTLADIYGAKSVLYMYSEWHPDSQGGGALRYRFLAQESGLAETAEIVMQGVEAESNAITAMYESLLDLIDSSWRGQLLVDTGEGGSLETLLETTNLKSLVDIEERLSGISLVNNVQIKSVGLPVSKVSFDYTGREDQLIIALKFAGLTLSYYGADRLLALETRQGFMKQLGKEGQKNE